MDTDDSDLLFKFFDTNDDFFGLPLEPLHDFNALIATDLDDLLDQFEEETKRFEESAFLQQQFINEWNGSVDAENKVVNGSGHGDVVVEPKASALKKQAKPLNDNCVVSSLSNISKSAASNRKTATSSLKRKKNAGVSLLANPSKSPAKQRLAPQQRLASQQRLGLQQTLSSPQRLTSTLRSSSSVQFHYFLNHDHNYCPPSS